MFAGVVVNGISTSTAIATPGEDSRLTLLIRLAIRFAFLNAASIAFAVAKSIASLVIPSCEVMPFAAQY